MRMPRDAGRSRTPMTFLLVILQKDFNRTNTLYWLRQDVRYKDNRHSHEHIKISTRKFHRRSLVLEAQRSWSIFIAFLSSSFLFLTIEFMSFSLPSIKDMVDKIKLKRYQDSARDHYAGRTFHPPKSTQTNVYYSSPWKPLSLLCQGNSNTLAVTIGLPYISKTLFPPSCKNSSCPTRLTRSVSVYMTPAWACRFVKSRDSRSSTSQSEERQLIGTAIGKIPAVFAISRKARKKIISALCYQVEILLVG